MIKQEYNILRHQRWKERPDPRGIRTDRTSNDTGGGGTGYSPYSIWE